MNPWRLDWIEPGVAILRAPRGHGVARISLDECAHDMARMQRKDAELLVRYLNAFYPLKKSVEELTSIVIDCDAGRNYREEIDRANAALDLAVGRHQPSTTSATGRTSGTKEF